MSKKYFPHILIAVIIFFAFANMLTNSFVWDDEEQIVNNPVIRNFSNLPQILSGATFNTGGAGLSGWFFRPALTFSYMLIFRIWGANPFGFHLFQLLIHIGVAILLFEILELLSKDLKSEYSSPINALISIIFGIHAGISEAVSYAASFSEIGYTIFNLAALLFLLTTNNKTPSRKTLIVFSAFLFIGLTYKESSAVIFPIILIYLFLFKNKGVRYWLSALGITAFLYIFVRLVLAGVPIRHPLFSPISEAPFTTRLLTIPLEFFSYLRIIFFPAKLSISQQFVVTYPNFRQFILPLAVSLLFSAVVLFLAYKLKSKLILFGLSWFVLGFLIISNLIPLDMTTAERWLYFPIIGIVIIFSETFNIIIKKKPKAISAILFLSVIAIAALSIKTIIRNADWKNGLTLFSHDALYSQNSFDLENNLGVELFRAGKLAEAKVHFENSIELQPKWYFAYNNLGVVYERGGSYSEAKELYEKTLSMSDYYLAYQNLAALLLKEDPKKAEDFTQEALKKLPGNPQLWLVLAVAQDKLGKKKEAERSYSVYLSLNAGN